MHEEALHRPLYAWSVGSSAARMIRRADGHGRAPMSAVAAALVLLALLAAWFWPLRLGERMGQSHILWSTILARADPARVTPCRSTAARATPRPSSTRC